jgi:hypothetical protein
MLNLFFFLFFLHDGHGPGMLYIYVVDHTDSWN